jgi:hypothetical protein
MRKLSLLFALIFTIIICEAQYNPRPTKSRFFNSKHSTFQIQPGDVLVYSHKTVSGEEQDVIVTIEKFGEGLSYHYKMSGGNDGQVTINSNTFSTNSNYSYNFSDAATQTNQNNLWLSKKNWRDLASKDKRTVMNVGNGAETFVRNSGSTLKINYKGKEKIITVYNIIGSSTVDSKSFTVLSDEKNPLITSMNFGGILTLKEVR